MTEAQNETAVQFVCEGEWLLGVAHVPVAPRDRGMVIITGGPQYRVGSHRQFTLLARRLAANDFAVLRFDYRGMGDSEGAPRSFEALEADIRTAIDALFALAPSLKEVVLWGLCDAVSAALFYAHQDKRVAGIALLNPWVRSESGIATAYLKHYYTRRLFDPDFWRKLAHGRFNAGTSTASLLDMLRAAFVPRKPIETEVPFPQRMLLGLQKFRGRVLLILSGNDLTAAEFGDLVNRSPEWRRSLQSSRITRHELPAANHTFSKSEWRAQVEDWTLEWIRSW